MKTVRETPFGLWHEVEELPTPEPTPTNCDRNWKTHNWTLTIEEGSPMFTAEPCDRGCVIGEWGLGDDWEWAELVAIPINIDVATDCPGYPVDEHNVPTGPPRPYFDGTQSHPRGCDCNHWPVAKLKGTPNWDGYKDPPITATSPDSSSEEASGPNRGG